MRGEAEGATAGKVLGVYQGGAARVIVVTESEARALVRQANGWLAVSVVVVPNPIYYHVIVPSSLEWSRN